MTKEILINRKNLVHILLLISIIILAMISLQTDFASDININNATSGGLGKVVEDSNNGDRINLDNGIYRNNVTDIQVAKDITIAGKDPKNTIIDARKQGRIFYNYRSLTLINLTLINGYNISSSGYGGGAIYNGGNLTLINCTLINNTAYTGGAIANSNILTIRDSKFENNIAEQRGGAIYNDYGMASLNNALANVTIINSNFTNNTAIWAVLFIIRIGLI